MDNLIDRQAAISAICNACGKIDCDKMDKCEKLQLPPANCSEFPNNSDTISRAKAIEALDKRFDSIPMEQTSEILMLRKDLRDLPPAQPVQCEDAVSREKVKELAYSQIRSEYSGIALKEQRESMLRIADNVIGLLPSVTPKQRTGKWVKLDMHRGMADHKCTACGQECYVPTCMGEPLYAFCPNCGKKMKKR